MADFVDPYIDEATGELRNLLGAKSSDEFKHREAQIVFANELDIESANIPRTNDFAELLALHKHLFGGVYDWAGEIRTVDIKKNTPGAEYFLIVGKIRDAAGFVFSELGRTHTLIGLERKEFTEQLAYFYDQLNYIHPFREGNGRTQRLLWTRIARDAGYDINWDAITGNENDEASRLAAEDMDLSGLIEMFEKIIRQGTPTNK